MNSAYSFNSSASSFRYYLDLNEDHIPDYEQNGSTTNPSVLLQKAAASSSTCPAFCNLARDYQSERQLQDSPQTSQKVDKKIVLVKGSSAGHVFSASYQQTDEDSSKDRMKMADHENRSARTKDNGSTKRTSSKMRIMRRMLHSIDSSGTYRHMLAKSSNSAIRSNQIQINSAGYCNKNAAEVVRVCSDCRTTKTPLWRGGPQGPKSLCNACGIRRRKAREAIALAAEAAQDDTDSVNKMECNSFRGPSKAKKLRTSYHDVRQCSQTTVKSTLSFEDFAMSLINKKSTESLPRDEEEAAILLMALSCGPIHS